MRLPEVLIAEDAVEELGRFTDASALVVMDANTREVCGERALAALPGASEYVFEERFGLLAGVDEASRVADAAAGARAGVLVAVGSGVITDIVRHGANSIGRDFVSVPTAASMDGYASSVAAMQIEGVKVTFPARAPVAILADPRVVAAAPLELTRAGVGDLLGKVTARVDWLASHLLYGEAFDPEVAARVLGLLQATAAGVLGVVAGEAAAVRGLLAGLIESGVAMAVFGNSRPASGCEHHASHFWDLLAAHGRRPHASHGLQVGYATRFAMRLQQFAFGGDVASVARPLSVVDPLDAGAVSWLGEPTAELREAVSEKQRFIAGGDASWPRDGSEWERVRASLEPSLALFEMVSDALDVAGIPSSFGYLDIDEEMLRATFHYASRLRARYTVIDFLEGQGRLDQAIEATLLPRAT